MSASWPCCVTIGCRHAGRDFAGEAKWRYATDEGNTAQRAVYFLGSFVVGKPDKTIRLCHACWQSAEDASQRIREGRETVQEEMAAASMEYLLTCCLAHLPLAFFIDILNTLVNLPCDWEAWARAGVTLNAIISSGEKSSATVAHDDVALMSLYASFLQCIKKPGVRGYTTAPELTAVLLSLSDKRREAVVVEMTTLYGQIWQTVSQTWPSIIDLSSASSAASSAVSSYTASCAPSCAHFDRTQALLSLQRRMSEQGLREKQQSRPNRVGLEYRCKRCGQPKKGHVCTAGLGAPFVLQDEDNALITSVLMSSHADEALEGPSDGDVESWLQCISNEKLPDQLSPASPAPADVWPGAELNAVLPEDVESDAGQASMLFSNAARGSKRLSPEARAASGDKADASGTPKRIARDGRDSSSSSSSDGGSSHLAAAILSSFLPSAVVPPVVPPGVGVPPVACHCHGAASSVQPYAGGRFSSFLPSAVVPPMVPPGAGVPPGVGVPPVAHGVAASVQPCVGGRFSSFLPSGLHGVRPVLAIYPSRTVPAPTEEDDTAAAATEGGAAAAATEDSSLLPSPPMSPPEDLSHNLRINLRIPTRYSDPALPIAMHPLTLRFFPPTAEAVWRAENFQSVRGIFMYACVQTVVVYSALGLAQANQAIRLWLLAWAIGSVPAALLLLWLREQGDGKHRADRPSALGRAMAVPLREAVARSRLLDWGVLSLCVLPQLILTVQTRLYDWGGTHGGLIWSTGSIGSNGDKSNGLLSSSSLLGSSSLLDSSGLLNRSGLLDPLDGDSLGGAGAFGRVLANWWVANFQLHSNCTEPALLILAVALSAALLSFQAPISLAPFQERLLVYKGFLGGQLSGYVFQRQSRCNYFHEQRLMDTQRAKLKTGAARTATTADWTQDEAGPWTQDEARMDSVTLCFGSSALEARYRNHCFNRTARLWFDCMLASDIIFQLIDFISGQVTLLESLSAVIFQTVPLIGHVVVHRRGNRRQENHLFRHAYLVWCLLLLVAKLLLPSAACGSNVETWFIVLPSSLRLQGPSSIPLCWTLSLVAIALSSVSPSRSWRNDQSADASAMRDAVVAAEFMAYVFDWQLRASFLRAQARNAEVP